MADPVQLPRRIKRRKPRPTHLVPRVGTFVLLGALLCIWWWSKYGPEVLRTVASPKDGPAASVRYAEPRSGRDVPLVRYVGSRSRGSPHEETGWDRLIGPVHNKTAYSNLAAFGCVLIVLIALVRLLTLPNPHDKENRHAAGTRVDQGPRRDRA